MGSQSPSRRLVNVCKLALTAVVATVGLSAVASLPAGAAAAPSVSNGVAGYDPGSTSPANQFNALTLVAGGAASVNTASLTIVSQPVSGSATVSTSASNGIISYTPASGTTGTQTLTFAYCAPGDTYPSAGNCTTATLSYLASSGQYFGDAVEGNAVVEQLETAVALPTTAVQGSTVTMSVAPVATSVPANENGDGTTVTVESASQFSVVMPVPKGFTYVPGSIGTTGGDATTSGNFTASYCTAPVADACTAQIDSGNYKTVYPYIETYLNPSTTISGGSNVTLPTVTAQFTASGAVGAVVPVDLTEFALTTTVSADGITISAPFDGYPSCSACGSANPPTYSAPTPLTTTTITSATAHVVSVSGVSPNNGPPSGGTSVTVSGNDLANASAVDFGSTPAAITADSASSITATSPAGSGTVDVTVTTPDGTSASSSADQFTYTVVVPPPTLTSISPTTGATAGGTSVTITGTNLANATAVDFGSTPGVITADSASSITATSPAGSGTVDVTVTTPTGTTTPVVADQYSFGTQVTSKLSTWTDTQACSIQATTTVPVGATAVQVSTSGAIGGGGGGAASSDSGGSSGSASSVIATFAIAVGQQLTAVNGCAGATAPNGSGVVSTGGAGGTGYSNGGGGGNGYYCAGVAIEGQCIGDGGADGSGGGGGGSSAVCIGTSCQVGVTPLVVAAGGGGGGESMCAGSDGGSGGTGGGGSSTSSVDLTGAGPSGTNGGSGDTSGDVGGIGGANNTGDSSSGTPGGPGSDTVSLGDSAGNGGGGGGFVGGTGSTATAGVDCGAGGGGGAGSSWAANGSAASFGTTSAAAATTLTFFGFVGTKPAVSTNPTSKTVNAGQVATFTAAGSGNPSPTIQWQVSTNGGTTFTNILGATSGTLSLTTTAGESSNQYRAVLANSLGLATTSAATLTVDSPPTVTTSPSDVAVVQGQPATFTAAASGTPTPTVQWQVSTDGGTTFTNIGGATSPTYTFTTAAGESGNEYQAVFTNPAGSVATTPATLLFNTLPAITASPTSIAVVQGQPATFTAAASGTPAPTVQWQVSTNGGTTFTNIGGATGPTYTFTTAAGESGNEYQAVFTNSVGSATSSAATLTFDTAPVVTTQPTGVSVVTGQPASFTAAASGSPAPSVQWQISTNAGVTFTNIGGATTGTYNLSTTTLAENNYRYRAVFTNPAGSATSNPATLAVSVPPLTISTSSLPAGSVYSKASKDTYQATLTATGGNPPYKWALQSGSLPSGLKLSSKGVISGKATFSGTFTFTIRVTDTKTKTKPKTQNLATKQFSITIN
jgi:hypothetical protein